MIGFRHSPSLPPPAQPFAHLVDDGTYLHVSGLVVADLPDGATLRGDAGRETAAVMAALAEVLAAEGCGLERLVRVWLHVTDLRDVPAVDAAYAAALPEDVRPARTCVAVSGLVDECRVEITATALKG